MSIDYFVCTLHGPYNKEDADKHALKMGGYVVTTVPSSLAPVIATVQSVIEKLDAVPPPPQNQT